MSTEMKHFAIDISVFVVRFARRLRPAVPPRHEALQLPSALPAARAAHAVPAPGHQHQQPGVGLPLRERGGAPQPGPLHAEERTPLGEPQGARRRLVAQEQHPPQNLHREGRVHRWRVTHSATRSDWVIGFANLVSGFR